MAGWVGECGFDPSYETKLRCHDDRVQTRNFHERKAFSRLPARRDEASFQAKKDGWAKCAAWYTNGTSRESLNFSPRLGIHKCCIRGTAHRHHLSNVRVELFISVH